MRPAQDDRADVVRASRRSGAARTLGALGLVGLTGVVGYESFSASHVARVTGRHDAPRVSCTHCHRDVEPPRLASPSDTPRGVDPLSLALSPDGARLFVAAPGVGRVIEVDVERGAVARTVDVAGGPQAVALSPDGERLAVTCRDRDEVALLDTARLEELERLPTGPEPTGVTFDGARLWVAQLGSDDVAELVPGERAPRSLLRVGSEPYALARADDLLAVVGRRVPGAPPGTAVSSELTLVDAAGARVRERRELTSAHLGRGVVLSSDGAFALAPVVHVRHHLPITQVARGAVMNSCLVFAETRLGGRTVQLPLDEVNACFADPSGVALTPDDRLAFVAHGGARVVSVVDVEALRRVVEETPPCALDDLVDDPRLTPRYVVARIPVRDDPRDLVLSPDGRRLYVAERLADSIAVIDVEELAVVERIDLGGPEEPCQVRRGERVFHDAAGTFQGQFSCRSCHPEGHTDGLIWDFEIDGVGQNLLETRSLRGIKDTPPFKWSGKNPDLHTQCGPRFARVLTRSDPFSPDDLDDLVAYIESIPLRARRAPPEYEEARARGRELFFRTHTNRGEEIPVRHRCNTCHRPPLFTDRLKADVGTGAEFDTPHLFDVSATEPYLHDGRSPTLEEIWTVHSPNDEHGVTSDLSKIELNDLVAFLRSL